MSIEKAYQEWCENLTDIATDEEVFTAGYEAGVRGWQAIETAPKDGTKILAYTNDGYRFPLVSQCLWDDGWWPDVWESPEEPLTPTHWMPLPESPK